MKKGVRRILAFGANSAICQAVLRLYAGEGASFFLLARDSSKLAAACEDLIARGGRLAGSESYDFNDWRRHEQVVQAACEAMGGLDLVLVCHGSLPDQAECESSSSAARACAEDNFTSASVIVQASSQFLAGQGTGTLAVLSSVAGDRGRKSNYSYGAAKAGLDALLQGLRGRFHGTGVKVVNIKPGMIVSPMTQDMEHGFLWSTPERIAPQIRRAIECGRAVSYAPGYWRLIMWVIRALPAGILARLPI